MFVTFCFLLMIRVAGSSDDQTFDIKSVAAQQNVTLTCPRSFGVKDLLFWLRIISGHQPEFLGGTYAFDLNKVTQTTHFTTKQGPGTFILHINHTQINDTGLYYCIRTSKTNMTFLRGVLLKVKAPPSAAVHPGESVSLQCSVLSDSEKKTCSEDYRVHWFRAGSHQSHPSFIYTHGDNVECGYSSQKCFYNFSKKVNVSDAGTYYCAVAACGEVMFGNGTNVDIKDSKTRPLNHTEIALCIVCVALAAIVIVSVYLIWTIKKKNCNCGAEPASSDQQRDEASLTYSAPTFSRRKVTKAERGNTHSAKKETIYSDVRFHN
ncbi:uncharacterized protein LOC115406914 isoform X4 [Salarias fasciatus]|uniref:uncharacterized protein LOC115406914 isoform X4 n=1 Tax=Salarias fasciatus TaxID=181472 RepID=UPI00117692B2|nr:uncharacterized protein LOC115406914 isoform X4 [Salarias fasciatus]